MFALQKVCSLNLWYGLEYWSWFVWFMMQNGGGRWAFYTDSTNLFNVKSNTKYTKQLADSQN